MRAARTLAAAMMSPCRLGSCDGTVCEEDHPAASGGSDPQRPGRHRDPPDVDKLCQLLIRFTLQDMGESQARRSQEVAETRKVQPSGTKGA